MAASKAPNNTTNVSSAAPSSSSSSSTTTTTTTTTNNNIEHNFHELCRSCGKTNAELYDLFQATNSPFCTSSTTCYTHLNNSSATSSASTSASASASTSASTTNKPTTADCTTTTILCAQTFDSVAATAKATAKGQSNMDNILQEMQIWQLLIKCNDGLPQRICAKCTAQFYMIHKFRRKCLKVQTQLRALYEEQQKFYERQQQKEKNVTVKDATIEATSTPASPPVPVSVPAPVAVTKPAPQLVEVVKPPAVMHKVNDLVNDNYGETQQAKAKVKAIVDNTNTNSLTNPKSSVSFEANTGNTNDFIAPSTTTATATTITTTILPNNVETMLQEKTEANEPTPTSSPSAPVPVPAPAFIDKTFEARIQENCMATTGLKLKDEKIPLLKPAVLVSKRSPPLTLQQPLEQICDNETAAEQQTNASKKPCLDHEDLLETPHILLFKSSGSKQNDLKQCQKNDEELFEKNAQDTSTTSTTSSNSSPLAVSTELKLQPESKKLQKDLSAALSSKTNSESLFITKAALKAYTIPPSTSETENRDYQKPITNSVALDIKNANDNNNNAHNNIYSHRYDNRNELNDNTCSSTSYSATPSSSCSPTTMSSFNRNNSNNNNNKQEKTNISRLQIIKYADHNRRPGHCYKSNVKSAAVAAPSTATATTKMARTIQKYGREMVVKRKQRSQLNKYKLKRLPNTKTSTTSSKGRQRRRQQQKLKMCHKKSLQQQQQRKDIPMEDEMSTFTNSAPSSTTASPSSSPSSSTSSTSSAISSTSSPLRATTPAAIDLVRNFGEVNSYCRNTKQKNMNKKGCSSTADRLSSNKSSCIMWKTKAAMKANANDMPVEVVAADNDNGEPTSNIPEISLPYKATATPTGSASSSSSSASSTSSLLSHTALATATEPEADADTDSNTGKSSKNLYENQSISDSSLEKNNKNNNNNNLIESQLMSLAENKVKDKADASENLPKTAQNLNHNLQPEEEAADQKQINTNNQTDNKPKSIVVDEKNTQAMEFINAEHQEGQEEEVNLQDMEKKTNEQQEPIILTSPPAKVGGMKLIIKRKRGARFKCRRKYDDETPATHDNHEPTTSKRKKKSSHTASQLSKLEMVSFFSLDNYYSKQDKEAISNNKDTIEDFNGNGLSAIKANDEDSNLRELTGAEDENKENPIPLAIVNNHELDSDSTVSEYRDPLLIRNEMLEEDTHLTDFSKTQLSIQSECSKEMYKLYKEKANLESPKKLIVRVPLTSLTQDFKRLHLTMEDQEENEVENKTSNEQPTLVDLNLHGTQDETLCIEVANEQENLPLEPESSLQANTSSSQSDLLGFSSQNTDSSSGTVNSSQPSIELMRYIEPPLCSASSKINDFINDFQNNCIDSSELEDTCDMIPTLVPGITQELSDEIRDVEDTLNGILSEMHDKDMYTPRSGETDEFFSHSVYSPLTDTPTTPSQSFYAESPCTISSNPMSVSPFIHHNMDYNAMTPQSNHSSMGLGSSYMSAGGSTGPHTSVYSEHYPTYKECFEETTQSELIGFQNDIPCFENIAIPSEQLQAETYEETAEMVNTNDSSEDSTAAPACENNIAEEEESAEFVASSHATQLNMDTLQEVPVSTTDVQAQQNPYCPANYQHLHNAPTIHIQNTTNPLITSNSVAPPHYIVTNTNQGPILIANPQLNPRREQIEASFKPHNNNLQFVTLGQAMEANQTQTNHLINTNPTKINWPTSVNTVPNFNQQPVLTTANGTTTYFINANGGLYQANIPTANLQNSSVNTIFVPTSTTQSFNKTSIDNNDNYMQAIQQQQQQQQQQRSQHQNNAGHSSQYIMLVNNLAGSPRYYATANLNQTVPPQPHNISTPTVLLQPSQGQTIQQSTTTYQKNSTNQNNNETTKSNYVPITPASESQTDTNAGQTIRQRVNQQLQKTIKQRQLQNLQPRLTNVTQNITLVCRFCHKRPKFNNNVDYSNHIINTHPAEKPYNCPHCPMHFSRRSQRQTHVAQVHGSRYQCAQCGLSFCAQRTLDFHLQKYHASLGRSAHQHLQQNSSFATAPAATYQLLQHNQQQRLVRVEDVHVQVTGENKNKRSIDLTLDDGGAGDSDGVDIKTSQSINEVEILSHTSATQQLQQQQQQSRKLCCPDCNGDNDDCCGMNQNDEQNDNNSNSTIQTAHNSQQFIAGNESVNNHSQQHPPHVTIPSPEQTEPDSTTTLRHFRKRQLSEISPHFASASPSSSSSSTSSTSSSSSSSSSSSTSSSSPSLHNNAGNNNNGGNDNINLNDNSPDNFVSGDGGGGGGGGEQIVVERVLRDSHNCLLCEESFTNEIALRKHHHLVHGAATQSTTCSSATTSMPLMCTICKRSFRMRNALQRHMETHDAEGRPYECNICQVRFPRPSQLTLHKLTVHKFEKPNSCGECGKRFGTESAMKAHAAEHEEAASAITASATEASISSLSSSQSQLPSPFYLETITTTNTTLSTNAQNIILQSSTYGEDSSVTASTTNNNDAANNATQNVIVSGLVT